MLLWFPNGDVNAEMWLVRETMEIDASDTDTFNSVTCLRAQGGHVIAQLKTNPNTAPTFYNIDSVKHK